MIKKANKIERHDMIRDQYQCNASTFPETPKKIVDNKSQSSFYVPCVHLYL